MSDSGKCIVAYHLTRAPAAAGAYPAPSTAADGVDIAAPVNADGTGPAWKDGRSLPKRGPRRALMLLESDAVTAITEGQIYYYVASLNRWYSIGLIYGTGAAALTATAGAMVEFSLPAAADRLDFAATISAGNVTARFVPVWEET